MQVELRHVTAVAQLRPLPADGNTQDAPQQLPLEANSPAIAFLRVRLDRRAHRAVGESTIRRISGGGSLGTASGISTRAFRPFGGSRGREKKSPGKCRCTSGMSFWGSREIQPALGQVVWQALPSGRRGPVSAQVAGRHTALRAANNPAPQRRQRWPRCGPANCDLLPSDSPRQRLRRGSPSSPLLACPAVRRLPAACIYLVTVADAAAPRFRSLRDSCTNDFLRRSAG